MKGSIVRDARTIVSHPEMGDHTMVLCVWQEGADSLLDEYRQLALSLPRAAHLEVRVMTKMELMRRCQVNDIEQLTTFQINAICRNIMTHMFQNRRVCLYIDECWITIPTKFSPHISQVKNTYIYHNSND